MNRLDILGSIDAPNMKTVGLPWVCIRANKNISIVTLNLSQAQTIKLNSNQIREKTKIRKPDQKRFFLQANESKVGDV